MLKNFNACKNIVWCNRHNAYMYCSLERTMSERRVGSRHIFAFCHIFCLLHIIARLTRVQSLSGQHKFSQVWTTASNTGTENKKHRPTNEFSVVWRLCELCDYCFRTGEVNLILLLDHWQLTHLYYKPQNGRGCKESWSMEGSRHAGLPCSCAA